MAPPRTIRQFEVNPPDDGSEPLCIAISGPPGSGKTFSALRLAEGISRVRPGKPAVIDSEAGRARKYHVSRDPKDGFDFDYIPITPPFEPAHFLDAINAALRLNPSCVIVDNGSDEHEGPGGVLEWHDREVPKMKGNEWAAWNAPKASRRVLTSGIQQIRVPIIMTFRARPKTTTPPGSKNPIALGYVPIAGDELIGIMDMFCLLPPRSNGVPVWSSQKAGEEFAIKLPHFLAPLITRGAPIDENLGERLGRWQLGLNATGNTGGEPVKRKPTPSEQVDAYVTAINNDETIETVDDLREYQADERRAKWVAAIKADHPALYERIVEANSRRFAELTRRAEPIDTSGTTISGDRESDLGAADDDDDLFPGETE